MRCVGIPVLLFVTGVWAAPPDKQPPDKYQTLLARLKQGDATVDFLELRRAYAASPDYAEGSDVDEGAVMVKAYNQGDFAQALAHANKVLDSYYLDIRAHQIASVANREMHLQQEAEFHHNVAQGLINAILRTGDGKSPQTAWEIISTQEESVVLQSLGLRTDGQSLITVGDHQYDKLEAVDAKSQQKVTLYFNVDAPMARLVRVN
jgi:hypothetical protein